MKNFQKVDEEFFVGLVSMLTLCSTDKEMNERYNELHLAIDKAYEVAKSFKESQIRVKKIDQKR